MLLERKHGINVEVSTDTGPVCQEPSSHFTPSMSTQFQSLQREGTWMVLEKKKGSLHLKRGEHIKC